MAREIKYYIVAANALPEIFVKVAEAKRMMQTGEADTVGAVSYTHLTLPTTERV